MSTNQEQDDELTPRAPALPKLAYTEAEACEIIGLNRDALRYYRKVGWLEYLPGGEGGGKILYRLRHLEALLDRIEEDRRGKGIRR